MIGKLSGTLDSVSGDVALVDVNGVGYVVHASNRTLARLGPNGGVVSLLIETQVREDAISPSPARRPTDRRQCRPPCPSVP